MEQPFLNAIYSNIHHTNFIMTFCAPQLKAEYLTECLLEVVNNQWKVNAIESGRSISVSYTHLTLPTNREV